MKVRYQNILVFKSNDFVATYFLEIWTKIGSLDRVYEHLESWTADKICKQIYSEHVTQTRSKETAWRFKTLSADIWLLFDIFRLKLKMTFGFLKKSKNLWNVQRDQDSWSIGEFGVWDTETQPYSFKWKTVCNCMIQR